LVCVAEGGSDAPKKQEDVALVVGASEGGDALGVIRKRGEELEAAILRRAEEGQPIHGELVRLAPRDTPLVYDVEVIHDARADGERTGPARVANDAYRKGWDRLFAKKRRAAAN
jgi:hypothetical protein